MAKKIEKYLTLDEITRLKEVAEAKAANDLRAGKVRGPIGWMVVDLALATGLRVSELAQIKIQDVNIRRMEMTVWRVKKRKPYHSLLPMTPELADHLESFLAWRETLKVTYDNLFPGKRGPLTKQGLQLIWKKLAKAAGMPDNCSIHWARHSFCTHLQNSSGDLSLTQRAVEHSSPSVTAVYIDVLPDKLRSAMGAMYKRQK